MVLGPFGKRALLYVHFPFRWMTTHKTAARRAQVPARSLIQGMCVPACQHLQRQFCGDSPYLAEAKWQPDGKNEDRWVMWGTPTRITEMIYRRQMCCDNQDESTMLRFHCLVAAQLAWMTLLSLIPLKWCLWTQLILTLTLWKTVALSDLTTTSHPAMQQPQTDNRISPQNFPKPDTGCVSVSFSWTGFQAEHSAIWLCALTYRALVHVEQSEKTWSGSSFLLLRTFWYMWLLHLRVEGIASKENAMFQVSVPHVVVEISISWSAAGHSQRCWRLDSCNRGNLVFVCFFLRLSMFLK